MQQGIILICLDDGCYVTDVPFCIDLGLDKITVPSPSGATDFDAARQILFLYNDVIYNETMVVENGMSGSCRQALAEVMCSLWTPSCLGGKAVPVCRETCEGITLISNCNI